ncbi:MAG: metallophosphoesterase [Nanoarchaeota archaeon]
MNPEILKVIREKGVLLEKEVIDILESFGDSSVASNFLEKLVQLSGKKIITKSLLKDNMLGVQKFVEGLSIDKKGEIERIFVKFGFTIEIYKEKASAESNQKREVSEKSRITYKIFCPDTKTDKKLEVQDFSKHFRARYQQLQKILLQRPNLTSLIAINKISSERKTLSIIGILSEKRITKNGNLILTLEDLTGKINVLVKPDRKEVFESADEMQLDDVVAVKASGNKDILFAHEIYFPDAFIHEKKKFEEEACIAFISDIHAGSERHLERSMNNFLEWMNSKDETAKKIKFLFIIGDNVDGVGIFPGQEYLLKMKSMEEQYKLLASYLKKLPEDVTIFMCPGQHDAVRVAEPQPIIGKKYALALYDIENLILVTNPSLVKLIEKEKEFNVLMYHGASIHNLISEIPELRNMKAHKCPAKAVRHMLKRRHLAPTHSSVIYIPNAEKDPMVISEVPDVLCTGEVHRNDIDTYNGVLIVTSSCWQAQTPYEEKVGNMTEPGKVTVLNLKTRELRIFDFVDDEEMGKWTK